MKQDKDLLKHDFSDDIEIKKIEMKSWKGIKEFNSYPRSLAEKCSQAQDIGLLERSIKFLDLHDKLVINVAGGHGKEAEFLVRKGTREVVLGDIALRQLFSAKIRKEKRGLEQNIELILLDAEHLPFKEKSFDFGYIYGPASFPKSLLGYFRAMSNC